MIRILIFEKNILFVKFLQIFSFYILHIMSLLRLSNFNSISILISGMKNSKEFITYNRRKYDIYK